MDYFIKLTGILFKPLQVLEEYKKSLIHHVVTGKVDVRWVAV